MDRNIKESLAGMQVFDINTLCVAEILSAKTSSIQNILFKGGWPNSMQVIVEIKKFLDDYINSYVEKILFWQLGFKKL